MNQQENHNKRYLRTFRAGLGLKLFLLSAVVISIIVGVLMKVFCGSVSGIPFPFFLALIFIYQLIKYSIKPLFIISEKEIQVYPHKILTLEQIEAVKIEGANRLELILKNSLPVSLNLWTLSNRDRRELRTMIESLLKKMIHQLTIDSKSPRTVC